MTYHAHSHQHSNLVEVEIHQQYEDFHASISERHEISENILHEVEEIIIHQHRQDSSTPYVHSIITPITARVDGEPSSAAPTIPAIVDEMQLTRECTIFGTYIAEVMKNMGKTKARILQIKFLQLLIEHDADN